MTRYRSVTHVDKTLVLFLNALRTDFPFCLSPASIHRFHRPIVLVLCSTSTLRPNFGSSIHVILGHVREALLARKPRIPELSDREQAGPGSVCPWWRSSMASSVFVFRWTWGSRMAVMQERPIRYMIKKPSDSEQGPRKTMVSWYLPSLSISQRQFRLCMFLCSSAISPRDCTSPCFGGIF